MSEEAESSRTKLPSNQCAASAVHMLTLYIVPGKPPCPEHAHCSSSTHYSQVVECPVISWQINA